MRWELMGAQQKAVSNIKCSHNRTFCKAHRKRKKKWVSQEQCGGGAPTRSTRDRKKRHKAERLGWMYSVFSLYTAAKRIILSDRHHAKPPEKKDDGPSQQPKNNNGCRLEKNK